MERIDTEVAAKLSREELVAPARRRGRRNPDRAEDPAQPGRAAPSRHRAARRHARARAARSRCSADDTVTDIMVNGPKQVFVERRGKLELTDVIFRDNAHVMSIATRIVTQVGRRIDESTPLVDARLHRRQPRQHHRPAARDRRHLDLDPQIRQEGHHARRDGAAAEHLAGDGDRAQDRRALAPQHPHLRRHRLGQDHAAQRHVADDRHRRAHRHHRGRGRAAAAAAACRAAGDAAAQPRRQGRDHHARSGEERAAHAPRPHHPRRNSLRRGARHAAGDEHRP